MKKSTLSVRTIRLVLFSLISFCGLSAGQSSPVVETGIEGAISISPSRPGPVRADAASSAPLANIVFAVEGNSGPVANFTTDEQGRFRILLKPGHYKVSPKERGQIRRCGPFDVDVENGRMAKVEWQCDSGMR